jgi:hypothetical protein
VSLTTREVMDPWFETLQPDMPISEAVSIFQRASREQGQKIFGMMVTDDDFGFRADAKNVGTKMKSLW